jgi:AAA domain-containing protein
MSIQIRNTQDLLQEELRLKILIYGPSGVGKSEFASGAPNPIIAACETGHGKGLLTVADKGLPFLEPETYSEVEQFCSGGVPGQDRYDTYVFDGFSYLTDTVIKNHALGVQRSGGNSQKRSMGIPEMDDYGVMAELERRLLAKLLGQPKHIIVTCLMDYYQPPEGGTQPKKERIGGPDLPGMMRLGSSAMFDFVFRLWTEPALRDPRDPKSRYHKRVFLTDGNGQYLAKSRLRHGLVNLYPTEVEFNLESGSGTFNWFLEKALERRKAQTPQ